MGLINTLATNLQENMARLQSIILLCAGNNLGSHHYARYVCYVFVHGFDRALMCGVNNYKLLVLDCPSTYQCSGMNTI